MTVRVCIDGYNMRHEVLHARAHDLCSHNVRVETFSRENVFYF